MLQPVRAKKPSARCNVSMESLQPPTGQVALQATTAVAAEAPTAWALHPQLVDQKSTAAKTARDLDACRQQLAEATKEIQKLKATGGTTRRNFDFQKKSCQEQHRFTEKLEEKLEAALEHVPEGPAKDALEESKSLTSVHTVKARNNAHTK